MLNDLTKESIVNSFRVTGLSPLDEDAVDYSKCLEVNFQGEEAISSNQISEVDLVHAKFLNFIMETLPNNAIEQLELGCSNEENLQLLWNELKKCSGETDRLVTGNILDFSVNTDVAVTEEFIESLDFPDISIADNQMINICNLPSPLPVCNQASTSTTLGYKSAAVDLLTAGFLSKEMETSKICNVPKAIYESVSNDILPDLTMEDSQIISITYGPTKPSTSQNPSSHVPFSSLLARNFPTKTTNEPQISVSVCEENSSQIVNVINDIRNTNSTPSTSVDTNEKLTHIYWPGKITFKNAKLHLSQIHL